MSVWLYLAIPAAVGLGIVLFTNYVHNEAYRMGLEHGHERERAELRAELAQKNAALVSIPKLTDELARALRRQDAIMQGFVPWPEDQPPQHNGSGEPCDMWIGPCLCGATHTAEQRESIP